MSVIKKSLLFSGLLCQFIIVIQAQDVLLKQASETNLGVKWITGLTWEQIKTKAQTDNKYIFVDCFATWCAPCKLMDHNIFQHWRVGEVMNDLFISVKVQMDTTVADNEPVKKWYGDAYEMKERYKVTAFPTFLFFTPAGQLIHSEQGYHDLTAFINLAKLARDPQKPKYYDLYNDYKSGNKLDYKTLPELAIFTKNVIGDKQCAQNIAREYKACYLNQLTVDKICTKENLNFIFYFDDLITSRDNFFTLCFRMPEKVDSMTTKGMANSIVTGTIVREEIENKVLTNGKAYNRMPNWKKIQTQLQRKYKVIDAKRMILDYQIYYYRAKYRDWSLWCKYKDIRIKQYPPKSPSETLMFAAGELNDFGAWAVFLRCPDRSVIEKALDWIEQALQLYPEEEGYMDTKANLLYKLGRREDALFWQKKALNRSIENSSKYGKLPSVWIKECFQKMKNGEPTWMEPQPSLKN